VSDVVEVVDAEKRSALCASVLSELPEWFGIEAATRHYIEEITTLPTFAVADDAFLAIKVHNPRAAEVYVMGVRPALHRRGFGTALLGAAEIYLRKRRVEYLQVKTLGPSDPDVGYARTRSFYEARGFVPLEELLHLWEHNPCLLLVKRL
jgi:GNAT superfamily N-acetyltransferase